jgi:hypothetical protein
LSAQPFHMIVRISIDDLVIFEFEFLVNVVD